MKLNRVFAAFLTLTSLSISLLIFSVPSVSAQTLRIIEAQSSLTFSPASLTNVVVGDTIRFVRTGGTHTTQSSSVPAGAATWTAAPLNSTTTTFTYVVTVPGTYNYFCTIHGGMSGSFTAGTSAIQPEPGKPAASYKLEQNYPNPFNPQTKIAFSIPTAATVTLNVYDIRGRQVASLLSDKLSAGSYSVPFDGRTLASGVYLYKLSVSSGASGDFTETKKMILAK